MRENGRNVTHQQLKKLFHNKFVVVLGDSIHRSVYKDIVLLLQKEKYLSHKQLKSKGELTYEQDVLLEGGSLAPLHNGTKYREVRQYKSEHHLVRFYFITRIFSGYMESILEDFRSGLKPDVVIVNSCVWDISRYNCNWVNDYQESLHRFFSEITWILPDETLVIWNLALPLGERLIGGVVVPEIEHKTSRMRQDVLEANFYSGTLADAYKVDVLDLHYWFRFSQHHQVKDGVHWNAIAHRRLTSLLAQHAAHAWGVEMVDPFGVLEVKIAINYAPLDHVTKNDHDHHTYVGSREVVIVGESGKGSSCRPLHHAHTRGRERCNYVPYDRPSRHRHRVKPY